MRLPAIPLILLAVTTAPVTAQKFTGAVPAKITLLGEVRDSVCAAWVDGDPGALEQLFLNLLVNAGQALKSGGRARVEVEHLNGSCVVTIHDSGIGIPADQLARVGEQFYTSKPSGTGLGLTIAKRIVEGHGGQLEIHSAPGRGTTARVSIPLSLGQQL